MKTKLKNAVVESVHRRGKYILLQTSQGHVIIHLGMSGRLSILQKQQLPQKHDHVDILFQDHTLMRYTDPRRFGCILFTTKDPQQHPLLQQLGPEPFDPDISPDYFLHRSQRRSRAVKLQIMDSKIVVGVGNIYANEALFKAQIHPDTPSNDLKLQDWQRLLKAIQEILAQAIQQGGTTLRDFLAQDGKPGYFSQQLQVYGRGDQPCFNCQTPLVELKLGQRQTVYCPHCQKP